MLTVYVRHYLTDRGIQYFKTQWFPKVHSIISQQNGYISIVYSMSKRENDLIDITLKFKDDAMLDAWIEVPIHDELIKALDGHRSRDYWQAVRTDDDEADLSTLEWMTIRPGRL